MDGAKDIFWIKSLGGTFKALQKKPFAKSIFKIHSNVPFWQFFRKVRVGCALLVRPSRIPRRISKKNIALGADEFLAMLEGKIRVTPFFKVQSGKITV